MKMKVAQVSLRQIQAAKNIRRDKKVDELVESIRHLGLLQPVGVNSRHELIYGFRRLAAVKRLRWRVVPAVVHAMGNETPARIAENTARKPLTDEETARALARWRDEYQKEHPETAKPGPKPRAIILPGRIIAPRFDTYAAGIIGVSPQAIQKALRLADVLRERPELGEKCESAREILHEAKREKREERAHEAAKKAKNLPPDIHIENGGSTSHIEAGSVDCIIADPPYGISEGSDIDLKGRAPVRKQLLADAPLSTRKEFRGWGREFARLLRSGGSLYVFCGDRHISHLRDALEGAAVPCPDCGAGTHPSFAPPHGPTCHLHGPVRAQEETNAVLR